MLFKVKFTVKKNIQAYFLDFKIKPATTDTVTYDSAGTQYPSAKEYCEFTELALGQCGPHEEEETPDTTVYTALIMVDTSAHRAQCSSN